MFPEELKQNAPLGGRISHFVQSWEKLTKDQGILEIVKGYKIPLLRTPVQEKIPLNTLVKENQKFLVEKEIIKKVNKESLVTQRSACPKSIAEQSFSCKEKDGGYRLVINLKTRNQFVPYMHFKMESLQTLKNMMKERDYMCKIDLKHAYLTIPLDKSCCHLVRFL